MEVPLADLPLGEVLERVAARSPAPGAGSSAALTCALVLAGSAGQVSFAPSARKRSDSSPA